MIEYIRCFPQDREEFPSCDFSWRIFNEPASKNNEANQIGGVRMAYGQPMSWESAEQVKQAGTNVRRRCRQIVRFVVALREDGLQSNKRTICLF